MALTKKKKNFLSNYCWYLDESKIILVFIKEGYEGGSKLVSAKKCFIDFKIMFVTFMLSENINIQQVLVYM